MMNDEDIERPTGREIDEERRRRWGSIRAPGSCVCVGVPVT